jgi:hypothetical protein
MILLIKSNSELVFPQGFFQGCFTRILCANVIGLCVDFASADSWLNLAVQLINNVFLLLS